MPRSIWKDTNYVRVYELARSGMEDNKIAKVLGVQMNTLKKWKGNRPALRDAFDRARAPRGEMPATFLDYVHDRLPSHLKELLDKIEACDKEGNGIVRIEAMLQDAGKRARQHLFLHSLIASNFNISRACSRVNISRRTFHAWVEKEPYFAQLMDEIHIYKKDFFEGALVGLVEEGDTSATIFANRTFNRDRGYNEKVEVEHTGTVNHNHLVVDVDSLDLPIEIRKTILLAMREKRKMGYDNIVSVS